MSRTFNAFEKATIKNSAKAVAHYLAKNEKIQGQIEKLQAEQQENLKLVEQYSEPVRSLTGYEPLDLCEKVSRNGAQNDWTFKYSTIIPPAPEEAGVAVAEHPANEEEAVTTHTPENPAEQPAEEEETPADRAPETPAAETQEPVAPTGAVAPKDPMDDIFN